jgi:hypothetical protein
MPGTVAMPREFLWPIQRIAIGGIGLRFFKDEKQFENF